MRFIHFTSWGKRDYTWVPQDDEGNTIPHIFGYTASCGMNRRTFNYCGEYNVMEVKEWKNFDVYQCTEEAEHRPNLLGGYSTKATPTGFEPWKGEELLDCYQTYWGAELEAAIHSGCFLVPKGAKVAALFRVTSGASKFPEVFQIAEVGD